MVKEAGDLSLEFEAYKAAIAKADGQLIPLNKAMPDGKKLFIVARHCIVPEYSLDLPMVWDDASDDWEAFLLIDVYAETEDGLRPIGHNDWTIVEDHAHSGTGRHKYILPTNEHENAAREAWGWGTFAFRVAEEYWRMGIGSLMVGSAGIALEALGMKTYYSGGLQPSSKGLVEKYRADITRIDRYRLPIEGIANNPKLTAEVQKFLY